MTLTNRVPFLLFLPVLFFGAGMLSAGLATRAAKLIAPEPVTLLDAIVIRNDEAIFRMISEGDDPGLPGVLGSPVLHWRRGDTTSPLLVAIGGGDINKVAYMAKRTQRIADPPNDQALCVAARYGHSRRCPIPDEDGSAGGPEKRLRQTSEARGRCGKIRIWQLGQGVAPVSDGGQLASPAKAIAVAFRRLMAEAAAMGEG